MILGAGILPIRLRAIAATRLDLAGLRLMLHLLRLSRERNFAAQSCVDHIRGATVMKLQDLVEEFQVLGKDLVDKVRTLIHEGNVRRIIIQDEHGTT
ncbi:MAG: DUF4342 domain-containing protein, partial [Bryobacteraceae bacterium]